MRRPTPTGPALGRELCQPSALAALALLAVNDHVLKGAGVLPGWLTGKLSDFAGLFLCPLLLFTLADALLARTKRRAPGHRLRAARRATLLTAAGFTAVKLHPGVNAVVSSVWGPMLLDATDLLALPAALLAYHFLRQRLALDVGSDRHTPHAVAPRPRVAPRPAAPLRVAVTALAAPSRVAVTALAVPARIAVTALAALACVATPRPMMRRNYPAWELERREASVGCANLVLWVAKSGKQGVGVGAELSSFDPRCRVQFDAAHLAVGGERIEAARLPAAVELDAPRLVYLPFAFDNETAWNDDRREGALTLALVVNGAVATVRTPMRHLRRGGPHVMEKRDEGAPITASPIRPDPKTQTSPSGAVPNAVPGESPPQREPTPGFAEPPPREGPPGETPPEVTP